MMHMSSVDCQIEEESDQRHGKDEKAKQHSIAIV